MKEKTKFLLIFLLAVFSFTHLALDATATGEEVCSATICMEMPATPPAKNEDISFVVRPLMTFDQEVYEAQEKDEWYITKFRESAFHLPNYNVAWWGDANGVIFSLLWLIFWILQIIGSVLVYFLLIFVNFVTGGLIKYAVLSAGTWAMETIFDWSNPVGFGFSLIAVVGTIAFMVKFLQNVKEMTPNNMMKLLARIILTGIVIGFIAPQAIEITDYIDTNISSFLSTASVRGNGEENTNITAKRDLYELLILQPYMLKNFGVGTMEELQKKLDGKEIKMEAKDFVESVMSCSVDKDQPKCLEKIYPSIKNDGLFDLFTTENKITWGDMLFKTFLMLPHQFMLSVPFFFIYFIVALFELIRWTSLIFSVFFLVGMFWKESNYLSFFINKIMWSFMAWGIAIMTSVVIFFIKQLISTLVSYTDASIILAFDIVLLIFFLLIMKFSNVIMRMLARFILGSTRLFARAGMKGNYSVQDGGKDTIESLSASIDKLNGNIEKMTADINGADMNANGENTEDTDNMTPNEDAVDTDAEGDVHDDENTADTNEDSKNQENDANEIDTHEDADGEDDGAKTENDDESKLADTPEDQNAHNQDKNTDTEFKDIDDGLADYDERNNDESLDQTEPPTSSYDKYANSAGTPSFRRRKKRAEKDEEDSN